MIKMENQLPPVKLENEGHDRTEEQQIYFGIFSLLNLLKEQIDYKPNAYEFIREYEDIITEKRFHLLQDDKYRPLALACWFANENTAIVTHQIAPFGKHHILHQKIEQRSPGLSFIHSIHSNSPNKKQEF